MSLELQRLRLPAGLALLLCGAQLQSQIPTRNWRPEDRTFITDLSRVTAVAATATLVFAATPNGLAIYDRGFRTLRETIGALEGYPDVLMTAMAADPTDDAVWLAGRGRWALYRPFGRTWDGGSIPGEAEAVVLDPRDPSRGAWLRVSGRWYFVSKFGGILTPASDVPPSGRRLGTLSPAELRQRAPNFDLVRLRIERDDMLRTWPLSSAASGPIQGDLFIGTDGNGLFRVDPVSYQAERFPAGLLGASTGAVVAGRGTVCAGSDDRLGTRRRGITCMREDFSNPVYYEQGPGLAALPGSEIRRLAITDRGIWAATNQGLLFLDRRGRRVDQVRGSDDLPSDDVTSVVARPPPEGGGAWVGTRMGLAFVADTGRLVGDPTGLAAGVRAMSMYRDTLWVATSAGIMARSVSPDSTSDFGMLRVEGSLLQDDVVAIAAGPAGVLGATRPRLLWAGAGAARWLPPAPALVGEVRVIVASEGGFWIGGTTGFAFLRPEPFAWIAVFGQGDLAGPVRDMTISGRYLWIASDRGLLRFESRDLLP